MKTHYAFCLAIQCILFIPTFQAQEPHNAILKPGKVDLFFKSKENSTEYNAILWTPLVKAGLGIINQNGDTYSIYGGGFFRPSQLIKTKSEWLIGLGFIRSRNETDFEFQSEYRFPFGLALGGGYVRNSFFESPAGPDRLDDYFFKASLRRQFKNWKYIATAQIQEVSKKLSPGFYTSLYNPFISLHGGHDGESWRACIGLISSKIKNYRLAVECLYIDKTIGENTIAPKILWINGTIGFKGGFLSHESRLGRAMGPTGLEYGNPLPYLIPLNDGNPLFPNSPPLWNRALEVWEIGELLSFRQLHLKLPNKSSWGRAEAVIFPFQFDDIKNYVDNIFIGSAYFYNTNTPNGMDVRDPAAMIGVVQRTNSLQANLQVEYFFRSKTSTLNIGIINWL